MDNLQEIQNLFTNEGGNFQISMPEFHAKLLKVKAFVFDWDGVFTSGHKNDGSAALFSEIDSMGTNLLRFGYWLLNNNLPYTALITGAENPTAVFLGKREHFSTMYHRCPNKEVAFNHLLQSHSLKPEEVAYVFDDVLDFPIATRCGLRLYIKRRQANPMLNRFVEENKLSDYQTGASGDAHAVREICELMLGIYGIDRQVFTERMAYSEVYKKYISERNAKDIQMLYPDDLV